MISADDWRGLGALAQRRCWLFDGDGVLHQDGRALPGACALIDLLRRRDRRIALITNSSLRTPARIAAELAAMGIGIDAADCFTSATAAVAAAAPLERAMVLGGPAIVAALETAGVEVVPTRPSAAADAVDAVIVGRDTELTYARLCAAVLAIAHGARFIATNPDPALPTERGPLPGAGAIVAAIAAAVGKQPELIAGKPGPALFEQALAAQGAVPADAVMLGDQLETDIAGAHALGIETLLVRTGIARGYSDARIQGFAERHGAPSFLADDLVAVARALSSAREQTLATTRPPPRETSQ